MAVRNGGRVIRGRGGTEGEDRAGCDALRLAGRSCARLRRVCACACAQKTAGACFWCTPGSCDLITNMPPSQYKESNLHPRALSHRPHE